MLKKFSTSLSTILIVLAMSMAVLFGWSKTGWKVLAVPTGSMEPSIGKNSLVVVHQVPAQSLKVGDVITYTNPLHAGQTISHRIIKTYKLSGTVPAYITKGDANKVPDIPVTSGSIIGKVAWHVPHAGAWLMGSKTWLGITLLVYIPATLLMFTEVKRLRDYLQLSMPKNYRLYGWRPPERKTHHLKLAATSAVAAGLVAVSAFAAEPAFALLQSNTVALSPNTLSVAQINPPPNTCHNNTNINVNNSSNQTAISGSASTSGNTTGGSAASGSASNNNSTNVNVSVTNGC